MNPALLPLLPAVPLVLAGLCVLVRDDRVTRALMIAVPLATAGCGLGLLLHHRQVPVVAHHVGGYLPGVAIPMVSDTLSALMLTVTGLVTAVCGWFLVRTGEARYRFVPALVLMLTAGVNGALLTGDLFNLFVFIEVMLLPSYALLAATGTWRRLGAARIFVLVNLLTSTILLIGVGFVYGVTGSVNLASLAGVARTDPRAGLAVAVVLTALAIKSGAAPVHGWLPQAYPSTSAGVMALFSGLHTKVGLYAVYRVYAVTYGGQPSPWAFVLVGVAVVTLLLGAVSTAGATRIRGALAYQMVSGIGHILVGVAVLTPTAVAAGLFYLVHHVVTMAALLLASGALEHVYGSGRYDRLDGLLRREPLVAAVFVVGLFSLVGLPPTSGLWGKVGVVLGAVSAGGPTAVLLVATVVVGSLVSLMALQRLWREVFLGARMLTYRPDDLRTGRGEPVALTDDVRVPVSLLAPALLLAATSVAMFLAAGVLVPVAQEAAHGLLDLSAYTQAVLTR